MHLAAESGSMNELEMLIKAGADVNATNQVRMSMAEWI